MNHSQHEWFVRKYLMDFKISQYLLIPRAGCATHSLYLNLEIHSLHEITRVTRSAISHME